MLGANGQEVENMVIRGRLQEIDIEIFPIVRALNEAGVETRASCSGHGRGPALIILWDGRWVIIARDHEEGRRIEKLIADSGRSS